MTRGFCSVSFLCHSGAQASHIEQVQAKTHLFPS
jgi:hypothetical protein